MVMSAAAAGTPQAFDGHPDLGLKAIPEDDGDEWHEDSGSNGARSAAGKGMSSRMSGAFESAASRRSLSAQKAKSFREERSVQFSLMQRATGGQYVSQAWAGRHQSNRRKYLMEFVGTLILNMTIGKDYDLGGMNFQPIAVTACIILVVAIGAPVSGAHYNPSLTAGFYVAGDRVAPSAILYTLVICASAVLAHFLMYALELPVAGDADERASYVGALPVFASAGEWCQACAAEFLGTYFAIFVVLYTAMLADPPLGTFGPVMVGFGFYTCIMTFGRISGAVLNPGLAVGLWLPALIVDPTRMEVDGRPQYWNVVLYVVAELLGGVCAGYTARAWLVRENAGQRWTWRWDWILEKLED